MAGKVERTYRVGVEQEIRCLSLGAGVQSSALLMMYLRGDLSPMPDLAVFADTMAEPSGVYRWLEKLKEQAEGKIPMIITSKGDIAADTLGDKRFASAPFFIKKPDGEVVKGRRQCTREYKLEVIFKAVRTWLGYVPRQRVRHKVTMLIGISTDEYMRMKPSRVKWIRNEYPLIDRKMSRQQCIKYVEDTGLGTPPRSACWFCPYHNQHEWISMRNNDPESWQKAVDFDRKIRELPKFKYKNYLHRQCVPLDQVVFKPEEPDKQLDMFNEICEGMCGV